MEASALHRPAGIARVRNSGGASFLRLRSDEQLVELFRSGHEEAFRVMHDRYRARLFAYTRQMLPNSRQDAEDALQDVFIRAYSGLRKNDRDLALRAWLYRVAHNRCVDQLRKNAPLLTEEVEVTSRDVSTDPMAATEQREDLRKLIGDVQRLPDQQRSALLMREMSGMSYQELAESLDLSVPAIKSLLVRARVGLAAAAEARNTDCSQIRVEIVDSHERGARPNALTRRHLSDCGGCREYRESVRGVSRSFAALIPAAPLLLAAKLLGVGTAYSAAAYSSGAGGAAAGGAAVASGAAVAGGAAAAGGVAAGGAVVTGGAVAGGVTAAHIAAILAAAAATAGGAVAATSHTAHHSRLVGPLHPAASVISRAVHSAVAHGYSPAAAVAPVAPVAAVAATAGPAAVTSANRTAPGTVSRLTHQSPGSAPAFPTATTSAPAGVTTPSSTVTTPASAAQTTTTASGTATTATTGSAAATTTTPTGASTTGATTTVAPTATAPTGTAATDPAATTTARTDSTSDPSATTPSAATPGAATTSPASTPPPSQ